jgi:hypothetical protein
MVTKRKPRNKNGKPKVSGKTELSLAGLSISSKQTPVSQPISLGGLLTFGVLQNREIPLDVFGVISKFLAGDFAFGTLANLNVANHGIRDETFPILYETVCLDNIKNLPHYGGGGSKVPRPAGFKYTKHVRLAAARSHVDSTTGTTSARIKTASSSST